VFQFLGSVNSLATHVINGTAHLGEVRFPTTAHGLNEPDGVAYIRPHEFSVEKNPGALPALEASILHIQPVGPIVRLEVLRKDNREILDIEITRERYRSLGLAKNETVYLSPHRMQVFPPDYSI